jgi:hypothetical protein
MIRFKLNYFKSDDTATSILSPRRPLSCFPGSWPDASANYLNAIYALLAEAVCTPFIPLLNGENPLMIKLPP